MTTMKRINEVAVVVSGDDLAGAFEAAKHVTRLNHVISRTCLSFPGGIRSEVVNFYKVGNYFDKIDLEESEYGFTIRFHIKPDVTSFWKDIVVRTIDALGDGVKKRIVVGKTNGD